MALSRFRAVVGCLALIGLPALPGTHAIAVAQTGRIVGTVYTTQGTRPLAVARVELSPTDSPLPDHRVVLTNIVGTYSFDSVPAGRYRLRISRAGYRPTSLEVQVRPGATVTVSVSIEADVGAEQRLPADTGTVVRGRVFDALSGQPIAGALVSVEGTDLTTQTDAEGRYRLERVPPGPQALRVRMIGYALSRVALLVPTAGALERDVQIAANPLVLEGMTVTADAVSRAAGELGTATVIETDAIRNQTATSLRGVLELVPGVDAQPPGLDDIQQIALRVAPTSGLSAVSLGISAQDAAAFGTLVVLDGVPLSNNANLQAPGSGNEIGFTTNAGGGVDLRRIPARTIERVEVIRGVPSARYGDLTQGAIIVETRAGAVDPEVTVQFDERTVEASIVGGHAFSGPRQAVTVSLDIARTESQPGLTSDAAYRFAGQLAHRLAIGRDGTGSEVEGRLLLDTRVDWFQLVDDRPTSILIQNRSLYTRERGLRVSERARLAVSRNVDLAFTGSYSWLQQRNSGTTPLTRGPMPITDRLAAGRAEGSYVIGPYVAQTTMEGNPHLWFGRFEAEAGPAWLNLGHTLKAGLEFRREWSSGPGYQFDVRNPPQVTFNGVNGFARPRSYDSISALVTSAFYIDDRVYVPLGARGLLTAQAGLRLDLLHRASTWLSRVRDAKLGPRFNFEISPQPWLRLRAAWGIVTKAPWLEQLYPAPQYYDVINVNWFANDPAERLAILTTFVKDPTNPGLGFAVAEKAEAGIEVAGPGWAISLVAFRDNIRDGVARRGVPGYVLREHYDLTDSTTGTGQPPDIIEPPAYSDTVPTLLAVPDNIMRVSSRGLELQAVLPLIRPLHTRLQISGQWIETRQDVDALFFGTAQRFGEFALSSTTPRAPYWGPTTEIGRRALLTYRIIYHQPALGLVLTGIVQHNVFDRIEDLAPQDTLAFLGYVTRAGELVNVPESERGDPQYTDLHVPRASVGALRHTPADWMLSAQVSKTLPLDGRLSFWAFNLLDREGIITPGGGIRIYGRMRFGLELMVPVRGFLPSTW